VLNDTVNKLMRLLAYSSPYADSEPLVPPAGLPVEFIDPHYLQHNEICRGADLEDRIRADSAPIPHTRNREGYHGDHHLAFWLSGYRDFRRCIDVARAHGVEPARVFEFGCSTARVLRHFHFQHGAEAWGCDFKPSSVQWCLEHLPPAMKVFQNDYYPHLPLEDRQFDLVTAFSVFTHLDETETGWLLELRRILRPGGIAYLSIHDEATWKLKLGWLKSSVDTFRPDIAALPDLPRGKTVVTFRQDNPYRYNTFHSRDYIDRVWGRYFDIVAVMRRQLDQQAVVVCRKPA
jgi:SAM-dependent methyltransferase